MDLQKQLLMKLSEIKHIYSAWLFLEDHLENWDILNCKGTQEKYHNCLMKGLACKVKSREVWRCKDMLLQC